MTRSGGGNFREVWTAVAGLMALTAGLACVNRTPEGASDRRATESLTGTATGTSAAGGRTEGKQPNSASIRRLVEVVVREARGLKTRVEADEELRSELGPRVRDLEKRLIRARTQLESMVAEWGIVDDELRREAQTTVAQVEEELDAVEAEFEARRD